MIFSLSVPLRGRFSLAFVQLAENFEIQSELGTPQEREYSLQLLRSSEGEVRLAKGGSVMGSRAESWSAHAWPWLGAHTLSPEASRTRDGWKRDGGNGRSEAPHTRGLQDRR